MLADVPHARPGLESDRGTTQSSGSTISGPLLHMSLLFHGDDEYIGGVVPFVEQGLAANEPALMFAPIANLELVQAGLHGSADRVTFLDASDVARNPARIIPSARRFAEKHSGQRVRIVGHGIWPGRSAAEIGEFVRHEALVNVLFADVDAAVLCPCDADGVDESLIADLGRTHPHTVIDGSARPSPLFVDPTIVLAAPNRLPAAPAQAETLDFEVGDLGAVRRFVQSRAQQFGLTGSRAHDLISAVNEAAANTLNHSGSGGTLRIWTGAATLTCEVADSGHIVAAHLAGRVAPPVSALRGRGMWMINQLCDLVELRSDVSGTVVRMQVGIE
jgi:anti-sigma regulatory factor (Ser/Thr protein kinase)